MDIIEVRGWYKPSDIRKIDSATMFEDEVFVWTYDGSAGHVKREQLAFIFRDWKDGK